MPPSHPTRLQKTRTTALLLMMAGLLHACGGSTSTTTTDATTEPSTTATSTTQTTSDTQVLTKTFGTQINPAQWSNYSGQAIPAYITKRNSGGVDNARASLGRVLFYDKNLSVDNTVACASCHKQAIAFTDTALASQGVGGGLTGRHSMRLINTRFAQETRFFWDKRAATLEDQTLQPIQDHNEMGFSGLAGRPALGDLLTKMAATDYYPVLFKAVYGDSQVTAARVQESLAHFVRSIVSFDSRYDQGRAAVANDAQAFPNFSDQENTGKALFLGAPQFNAQGVRTAGGLGCNACHRSPEFDIDPASGNNGIIGRLNAAGQDLTNTRAPSLRDLVGRNGEPNSPMMHTGVIPTLQAAIGHYGNINANPANTLLDPRLRPNGVGQQLQLTAPEVNAVVAFLRTLTGQAVYTDVKWSDPFVR